ncbi:MAG: hypothetical protein N2111_11695 [Candidatus Sumerlaeaceae bacterium]|nr:hypothetical protein [Candidatus Sumerlaeaceae bacterium]
MSRYDEPGTPPPPDPAALPESGPHQFPGGPLSPAEFPKGFWRGVDYLLHHPDEIIESLRLDRDLWRISRILFGVSVVMAALYGAIMGATNLLQGSPMMLGPKVALIGIVALKVPVLFLLTLLIVLPPVYVSNTFAGARLSFRQMLALVLCSLAITTTALASMATVALFFSLTSRSYDFLKLLHVAFFVYAGLVGIGYLRRCVDSLGASVSRAVPRGLFVLWLLLYMFVGTQLAWVLRPFVGSPNEPFQVFRPRTGSFIESVARSVRRVISE